MNKTKENQVWAIKHALSLLLILCVIITGPTTAAIAKAGIITADNSSVFRTGYGVRFGDGFKRGYYNGDKLDLTGLTVYLIYSDNSEVEVADYSADPPQGTVLYFTGSGYPESARRINISFTDGNRQLEIYFEVHMFAERLKFSNTTLPNGTYNRGYFTEVNTAMGGSGLYTYSAEGLPSGLEITPDGSIQGMPQVVASDVKFSVIAKDIFTTETVTATYTISIDKGVFPLSEYPKRVPCEDSVLVICDLSFTPLPGASFGAPVSEGALVENVCLTGTILTYNTTPQPAGSTATIMIPVTGAYYYEDFNLVFRITARDASDSDGSEEPEDPLFTNIPYDLENEADPAVQDDEEDEVIIETEPAILEGLWDNPFTDVHIEDWFYEDIGYVYENEIMLGTSADPIQFSPEMYATRGMIVTILFRMYGSLQEQGLAPESQKTSDTAVVFSDTAASDYYYDAVLWASERGIVKGYGDGRFGPNNVITRQDFTVILMRYAAYIERTLPEVRAYAGFSDEQEISEYAASAVKALFSAGVINGKDEGKFDPLGLTKRAEVAAMLHRFLELLSVKE